MTDYDPNHDTDFPSRAAAEADTEARMAAAETLLTYSQGLWYADPLPWDVAITAAIRDSRADAIDLLLSVGVRP